MKKIFIVLLLLLVVMQSSYAQVSNLTARQILDKTSLSIRKAMPFQISFVASQDNGNLQTSKFSGTFYTKGKMYYLKSSQYQIWFDGKTQWTYLPKNNEVNVSSSDGRQEQQFNPYYFIDLYKEGYSYTLSNEKTRGVDCFSIRLLAKKERAIKEVFLVINKKTFLPISVKFRRGTSNWIRISISSLKANQKISNAFFSFPMKKFPNVEIVDLR